MFGDGRRAFSGDFVSEETALGVPAIWAAVNVISGTIAHLPLHLYRNTENGPEKVTGDPLYRLVHDAPNDSQTSYTWRKWTLTRMLLGGRSISQIVRNRAGRVMSIIPIAPDSFSVEQRISPEGRMTRVYRINGHELKSSDVLDFPWLLKSNGLDHYCPIDANRDAIGLMIAAQKYAGGLLENGGVPPMTLSGPMSSPQASERASNDIQSALSSNANRKRKILPIPTGFDLKALGFDPASQQLIELRRFMISEAGRIFNVAPAMIHDLSTGTYSNVEQQNLNFAQHTIVPLVELIEQEMNAKLFGNRNSTNFVEFNLDGLQRGDFLSRMNGLARAVHSGMLTPNEARALDNRGPLDGGDDLMIQGATARLKSLPDEPTAPEPNSNLFPETDPDDPRNP